MTESILKTYYIGEGPEAEALIAEVKELIKAVKNARAVIQQEYGADALVVGHDGQPRGLAFTEKQNKPYLKGEVRSKDAYGYYPKRNCKQGKELASKLAAPELKLDISDYILSKLKLHRMCVGSCADSSTGLAMYSSVAGYAGGKVLMSIPSLPAIENSDPMTSVPAWFREVKKSELLAAQGR